MSFVATPNALFVQNSRACYFQVTVGNFKGWCEAIIEQHTIFRKTHFEAFKSMVMDFHKKGDIVAAEDVDEFLLSDTPSKMTPSNKFYGALPVLDPQQYTRDSAGVLQKNKKDKRKDKQRAPAHRDDGPSNRELKRIRQRAMHARQAEEAAKAAEAAEQ